jgi:hypothetical protein
MSTSTYRFCGSLTEAGELRLTKFGQAVELSDELASLIVLGGGSILPSADFAKAAFTEQELSLYSNTASHSEGNRAFQAKKKIVMTACHELRTRLEAGEPLKPTPQIDMPAITPAPAPAV